MKKCWKVSGSHKNSSKSQTWFEKQGIPSVNGVLPRIFSAAWCRFLESVSEGICPAGCAANFLTDSGLPCTAGSPAKWPIWQLWRRNKEPSKVYWTCQNFCRCFQKLVSLVRLDHSCLLCQRKLYKTHASPSDSRDKSHSWTHWPQHNPHVNSAFIASQIPNPANFSDVSNTCSISVTLMSRKNHNKCALTHQGISSCHYVSFHCRFVTPQNFWWLPYILTNFSTSFWNIITELNAFNCVPLFLWILKVYINPFAMAWEWEYRFSRRFSTTPRKYFCSCRTFGHSGLFHWNCLKKIHHFLALNLKNALLLAKLSCLNRGESCFCL